MRIKVPRLCKNCHIKQPGAKRQYCDDCAKLCAKCRLHPALGSGAHSYCLDCSRVYRRDLSRVHAKAKNSDIVTKIGREMLRLRRLAKERIHSGTLEQAPCAICGDEPSFTYFPYPHEDSVVFFCKTHLREMHTSEIETKQRILRFKAIVTQSKACKHCGAAMDFNGRIDYCPTCDALCHSCWEAPRVGRHKSRCRACIRSYERTKLRENRESRAVPRDCRRCGKDIGCGKGRSLCETCANTCTTCGQRPKAGKTTSYCLECNRERSKQRHHRQRSAPTAIPWLIEKIKERGG